VPRKWPARFGAGERVRTPTYRYGSMAKQQKMYPREFKLEAVQLVKSSGKPMSQIARDLGVSETALYRL